MVVIIAWREHLFLRLYPRDLVRAFSLGAEGEYAFYHSRSFLAGYDTLADFLIPAVAVGRFTAEKLAALGLRPLYNANLLAGIFGVELVEAIPHWSEIVGFRVEGVDAVIDHDEADALLWKINLGVISYPQIFASQP